MITANVLNNLLSENELETIHETLDGVQSLPFTRLDIKWRQSAGCNDPRRSKQLAWNTNPLELDTGDVGDTYAVGSERRGRTVGISPCSQSRFNSPSYRGNRLEALPYE